MAWTEVTLPQGVWVEVASGESEGLITAGPTGDIRVREEISAPPALEDGTPLSRSGNNFSLASGSSLYVKCKNLDSICYLDIV